MQNQSLITPQSLYHSTGRKKERQVWTMMFRSLPQASTSRRTSDMVPLDGGVWRKMAHHTVCTIDFQALNLHATCETHHTHKAPYTRHIQSPTTRRQFLTVGTVITTYHSMKTTVLLPLFYHPPGPLPLQNCTLGLHGLRRDIPHDWMRSYQM